MKASSQRVEGYSSLILFYEVDRRSNRTREMHFPKEYWPHTITKKGRLKIYFWHPSPSLPSLYLSLFIIFSRALLARRLFPYTWIENLSARARCMRTGGSKQIVLSYARPVGHLCVAREELK